MSSHRRSVWPSPISAQLVSAGAAKPGEVRSSGTSIFYSEARPAENGRTQIVCLDPTRGPVDLLVHGESARSRVHEYGGGAWDVSGTFLCFVDDAEDGALKWVDLNDDAASIPRTLSPKPPPGSGAFAVRYADVCIDLQGGRVFAVRETHAANGVVNEVIALRVTEAARRDIAMVEVIARGADFYGQLALSPDSIRLAFIRWMLPDMPWDATEVVVLDLASNTTTVIAGGPGESVVEPRWGPDGTLVVCSDRTGWWNPYRWDPEHPDTPLEAIAPIEAEIGGPMWVFGNRSVAWLADGRMIASAAKGGIDRLVVFSGDGREPRELTTKFTNISQVVEGPNGSILVVGGAPLETAGVHMVELRGQDAHVTRLGGQDDHPIDPSWISRPETIDVPIGDGELTHAVLYRPCNPDVPDGQGPAPLIVFGHGGPTSAARVQLNLSVQYWTSRGFAVADVNYRGSTGFGRRHRDALRGKWGIIDVADCASVAEHLVAVGVADAALLGIRGGSAGGFTTLAALCFTDTFTAGLSAYGIADLEILARDTHKFESRYLDRLIGPWPEARAEYEARSPIHHLDRLACPVGILQGADDAVVPPAQAEAIVAALVANQLPYAALTFAGEGHGFRQAKNIVRALEAELWFFAYAFDLELDEAIDEVPGRGLSRHF